jgi:molybdopterin-guanine dinucleotide biosynthesis protein A
MEGLAAGLSAIGDRVDGVFVTSCDIPLLKPAFARRLFEVAEASSRSIEIVVPRETNRYHPLSAIYRPSVLRAAEELLAADQLRMRLLFEKCRTREVPAEDFRDVDPELDSLTNCNRPEDYAAALAQCGFREDSST